MNEDYFKNYNKLKDEVIHDKNEKILKNDNIIASLEVLKSGKYNHNTNLNFLSFLTYIKGSKKSYIHEIINFMDYSDMQVYTPDLFTAKKNQFTAKNKSLNEAKTNLENELEINNSIKNIGIDSINTSFDQNVTELNKLAYISARINFFNIYKSNINAYLTTIHDPYNNDDDGLAGYFIQIFVFLHYFYNISKEEFLLAFGEILSYQEVNYSKEMLDNSLRTSHH